ncbi:hypothetical protein ACEWY4_011014 [Coilia grayii]|uniref:Leptin n=1 Tax=Coilia grayii TaxID=363190 RepID=A0ABD1K3K6_9TELE
MVNCITLLLPCLLVLLPICHGKPVQLDSIKRMIQIIRKTIDTQIEEYSIEVNVSFKIPDCVPGKQPIQGLGSVAQSLRAFQRMDDSLQVLSAQLKLHLSSLSSYLERYMASLQCPTKEPASFEKLDACLKDYKAFSITLGLATLHRLKEYTNKLVLGLDTLKTC